MTRQKSFLLIAAFGLMAASAGVLNWFRLHQHLGLPGIVATRVPGSVAMNIDLPAHPLDFTSQTMPQDRKVLEMLPKDTSFAQRHYRATDGFDAYANVILMGADRTSIHKPEFCLPGQGWTIDEKAAVDIPIAGPRPYTLPVMKWTISTSVESADGRKRRVGGVYVFWFVADNEETTSNWQRVWWLARDLIRTGELQRWAYVSYSTFCEPGSEDAAFERVKRLIAASVPDFQLAPGVRSSAHVTAQAASQDAPL